MISSTVSVKEDIEEIQLQYVEEIESVILKIQLKKNRKKGLGEKQRKAKDVIEKKKNAKGKQSKKELSHKQSKKDSTDRSETQEERNFKEELTNKGKNNPAWVKALWKKIAMKCHPDRLPHFKLSELEALKRKKYIIDARECIDREDWAHLIAIGIYIGEYIEEEKSLLYPAQKRMLEKLYNKTAAKVNDIQSSVAWMWGTADDDMTTKISIISTLCNKRGISIPSRKEIDLIMEDLGII